MEDSASSSSVSAAATVGMTGDNPVSDESEYEYEYEYDEAETEVRYYPSKPSFLSSSYLPNMCLCPRSPFTST